MPFDLAFGIILITVLSVLAFFAGRWGARRESPRPLAFASSLLLALVYAWTCSGKLAWAAVIPAGSVIFWSNLMPVLLAFAAGMASTTRGLAGRCRPLTITALLGLALAYTITPIARPIVAPLDLAGVTRWRGDVCLQSDSASCGPAAAATLLRMHGIHTDERQMAHACLTSQHGTEPLGLISGLAQVSYATEVHPQVASPDPQQWAANEQLPNIAMVRFNTSSETGSLNRFLGPRGEGHAVVVVDRNADGEWIIADPAFGLTRWTSQDFRGRFTGDAIYLAR